MDAWNVRIICGKSWAANLLMAGLTCDTSLSSNDLTSLNAPSQLGQFPVWQLENWISEHTFGFCSQS